MPTGYTAAVQDGTITEFPEFAMSCARAFGALIDMRDSPADAVIPEAFDAPTYHAKALREAQQRVAELTSMSEEEKIAAAASDYSEKLTRWRESAAKRAEQKRRYEAMLAKVAAWEPPTPEHHGLKQFMLEQLCGSLDFDCGGTPPATPIEQTAEEWHASAVAQAREDVSYHRKHHAEDCARTASRNQWLADLRHSLK